MIEWLALGALAIGSLFGSDDKRSSSSRYSPDRFDVDGWRRKRDADLQADEAAWRSSWEASIDRTWWIPQSVAHRIVRDHPLPRTLYGRFRTSTYISPTSTC